MSDTDGGAPEQADGADDEIDFTADASSSDDAALDQAEIDQLLDISADDDRPTGGLETLVGTTHIQHPRLPLLEACFDRLATTLSSSLRNFTWGHVELSMANADSVRFGDYLEAVPLPALISVFEAEQWNGLGLITIDSPLIYSIIDVLLGGRRASTSLEIEGRSFTPIESTLMERVIRLVLDDMSAAFEPLCKIAFRHERIESNPGLASIVHPSETAVVFRLDVDMGDRGGRLEVLIPDATLEPVRDLLQQAFMGDKFGQDRIWEEHWIREIRLAETELEVSLGYRMMSFREVKELEIGSTLQLTDKPEDLVVLTCGRIPLMRGRVGRVGETVAFQIHDWIGPLQRPSFKMKRT